MLNRSQEFSGRSLKALVVSTVLFILGGWGCSQKRIVPETSIDQRKPERQESVMAQNLSERARVVFLGPQGEGWSVNVEVARSPSQRARGLMGRKEMANDEGMLFVFGRLDRHSFYMKNTFIPLDIVFLSGDRGEVEVVGILKNMRPFDETSRSIDTPSMAAVELRSPMAEERGITPGTRVVIEAANP